MISGFLIEKSPGREWVRSHGPESSKVLPKLVNAVIAGD